MCDELTHDEKEVVDAARVTAREAKEFLYDNYHERIDPILDEIATTLMEYDVPMPRAAVIAQQMAEVCAINFAAGMRYQRERA